MAQVGCQRFIAFRVADVDGAPVIGLAKNNFAAVFLRNGAACGDVWTLLDKSSLSPGLYVVTYTPTEEGTDYLELYHAGSDIRMVDEEVIQNSAGTGPGTGTNSNLLYLTQDQGGAGALKGPDYLTRLDQYTLYVFPSQVWQSGDHNPLSALTSTLLDSAGNWIVSPLLVLRGVYHIVLLNASGESHVIKPFLDLTDPVITPAPPVTFNIGIKKETPTGVCDGVNTVFTLAGTPAVGTEAVYLDGLLMEAGATEDYVLVDNVITFNDPPDPGSKVRVTYGNKTVSGTIPTTDAVVITGETPSGAINGLNTTFLSLYPYRLGTLRVFLNGVRLTESADYTSTGANQFSCVNPPHVGDRFLIDYTVQV